MNIQQWQEGEAYGTTARAGTSLALQQVCSELNVWIWCPRGRFFTVASSKGLQFLQGPEKGHISIKSKQMILGPIDVGPLHPDFYFLLFFKKVF